MSHFDSASGLAVRLVGALLLVTSVSDGGGSRPLSQVVVGELCRPKHVSESCQLAAFQPVGAVVATWCYRFTVMKQ